jgi:hypothetical protein
VDVRTCGVLSEQWLILTFTSEDMVQLPGHFPDNATVCGIFLNIAY